MRRPEWHTPKGERRREQLLDAAMEVIAERGYDGVTQRSIAAAAGVPPASTHYFFDSIEALIREAAARYLQQRLAFYEERIEDFAAGDRSPTAGCQLVAQLLEDVSVDSRTAQFEIYLNARRRSELHSEVSDAVARLERLCATLLGTMGVPDPDAWAPAFLAVGDGFALRHVAGAPAQPGALEQALLAVVEAGLR